MFFEPINFLFPNDLHVHWSLMIVMYPYLTGLVAGAFIVSSLYHVFGKAEFKPVGRLALLTSLAFLIIAPLPLLIHLGHPERSLNIMLTPNLSSAMAGFGFIYSFYLLIVLLEIWLVWRKDIVDFAMTSKGVVRRWFYKILSLGIYDLSDAALKNDHKAVTLLAAIGIPAACLLHGYVGFLFGGLKSNPWWSTPLMPIIFLFSAVVSGIAALIVIYEVSMRARGETIDQACIAGLCRWLWLFMILSVSLELLEIVTLAYERSEEWEVISVLLSNQLSFSFISVQLIIGALISFILLMVTVVMEQYLHERLRNTLAFISAILLLIQVLAMRWNVVIGGQIFSKSFRGFRDFHPRLLEKEGVLTSIGLVIASGVILYFLNKILPSFKRRLEGSPP